MIREKNLKQLNLSEFITPNGRGLRDDNRWVQLGKVVPWSELTAAYNAVMNPDVGRPGKPARLVIGNIRVRSCNHAFPLIFSAYANINQKLINYNKMWLCN